MAIALDEAQQKATADYPADTLIVTKHEENEPEVSMCVSQSKVQGAEGFR